MIKKSNDSLPQSNLSVGTPMLKFQEKPKVFLETYGCQMNEYDSQLIRTILTKENFSFVESELEADIIMLNTCSVRDNANRKVYGRIHEIRHNRHKEHNGHNGHNRPVLIGVLGCMATNFRKDLFENPKLGIDFIAGPDSYKRLPELIREAAQTGENSFDVTLSEFETYSDVFPTQKDGACPEQSRGVNAWIAVMRGCNNFCTFCVVPYTRGRERSRSPENVVEEVRKLAGESFKQVTLLGQNVNSYCYQVPVIAGEQRTSEAIYLKKIASSAPNNAAPPRNDTKYDFADLLEEVSKVEGIERIRFTSPHPKDFPQKLLEVIAHNKKVCKHVHFPLQAGNDRVLDSMNRNYTQKEYLNWVEKIRGLIPNVSLTTDIIVGFPTETDAEFQDTVKVMKTVEYDSAFIFKYSERPHTLAAKQFKDDISDEVKTERIMLLNDLQKEISLRKNSAHIGETREILVEEVTTPRSPNDSVGRTDGNKLAIFPSGDFKRNEFVKVKITGASPNVLKGFAIN